MSFRLAEAIPVLERTPAVLRALLAGLPEAKRYRDSVGPWRQYLPVLDHGRPQTGAR